MYIISKNGFQVIAQKISILLVKRWFYLLDTIILHILAKFQKNRWRGFFVKSQNAFFLIQKGGLSGGGGVLFEENGKNGKKSKIRSVHFLSWIVPVLHAKFQKNRWSGFRAIRVTHARTHPPTHKGDSIGPFGFQPGTNKKKNVTTKN